MYYTESRRKGISYVPTLNRKKAKWIGRNLRRKCFLKHIIEGKIERTGRRGRRRKKLLNDLKEKREYRKMKEEALNSSP